MKVVQTELSDSEHKLLEDYSKRNSKTIKQVVKDAIRNTVIQDSVLPDDPIFTLPPSAKKTGKSEDTSTKHDAYLYGAKRRK